MQASTNGFGVFAYYTGTQTYNEKTSYGASVTPGESGQSSLAANFMFNQQVKWDATNYPETSGYITSWAYSPIKYWPNEVQNGNVDDQDKDAGSDPATATFSGTNYGGNLSFFAYAPYVSTINTSNAGITAINGNSTLTGTSAANAEQTDPIISYTVPASGAEMVDLLWGTYGGTSVNVLGGTTNQGVKYGTATNYQKAILPHGTSGSEDGYILNADLTKQKTGGTVGFAFKHALAKVGGSATGTKSDGTPLKNGLMVVLDLDDMKGAETGGTYTDTGLASGSQTTKVTITDVKISAKAIKSDPATDADASAEGFQYEYLTTNSGNLNLATGQWKVTGETLKKKKDENAGAVTTHNITSPASSGVTSSATLADAIAEPSSTTIGTSGTWANIPAGVTTTAQNVYKDETNPLIFIPGTYPELTITIHYTVRTQDTNLAASASGGEGGSWTKVQQVITKRLLFTKPVELNKQYSILMHLGLTGVKFTATVSDWEVVTGEPNNFDSDDDNTNDILVEDVYVPRNVGGSFITYTITGTTPVAATASSTVTIVPVLKKTKDDTGAVIADDQSNTWTYTSSDENVATVTDGGVVTFTENTSTTATREVTITVSSSVTGVTPIKITLVQSKASAS